MRQKGDGCVQWPEKRSVAGVSQRLAGSEPRLGMRVLEYHAKDNESKEKVINGVVPGGDMMTLDFQIKNRSSSPSPYIPKDSGFRARKWGHLSCLLLIGKLEVKEELSRLARKK